MGRKSQLGRREADQTNRGGPAKGVFVYVYQCFARDHFESCLTPIDEWLARKGLLNGFELKDSLETRWLQLLRACEAVGPYLKDHDFLRHPPYVGYDVANDSHYFFFKIDHAGHCFLASSFEFPVDPAYKTDDPPFAFTR